ncbi:hypothetical protein ACIPWL_24435 [Streptomyces sp. NPDC090023]|uniref:hypothetical protein n=1 Tax=unclassified Streptomyces TaxID=2593676 RepID=UPI003806C538
MTEGAADLRCSRKTGTPPTKLSPFPDAKGVCVSLRDHGWGDRAHSAVNTHSGNAAMFLNDGCRGEPYPVPGNSSLAT